MIFCIVASGSVTNFFPTVVGTLGYGNIVSLLLTAPPYVLCVITAFINAWHADRTGERYFHITLPLWVCVAAFIIAAATTATGPRYFAMMLMVPSVYTGYVVALAWISNTLPRPPAKRAAALAWINAVSNTSSIYASYSKPLARISPYFAAIVWMRADSTLVNSVYLRQPALCCCHERQLCDRFYSYLHGHPPPVHPRTPQQTARSWHDRRRRC
jgi:MFS family permease